MQLAPIHPTLHRQVFGFLQYPFCLLQFLLQIAIMELVRNERKNPHLYRKEILYSLVSIDTRRDWYKLHVCTLVKAGNPDKFYQSNQCGTKQKRIQSISIKLLPPLYIELSLCTYLAFSSGRAVTV